MNRKKRPIEVEAVFGQLKSNNKFSRFTLRSLAKVELEFLLMAIGHNLRKWAGKIAQTMSNTMPDPSAPINLGLILSYYFQNLKNIIFKNRNFHFNTSTQKLIA